MEAQIKILQTEEAALKSGSRISMTSKVPVFLLLLLSVSSCNSTQIVSANSTPAIQSSEIMDSGLILDIGIVPLDPNVPTTEDELLESLVPADVRRAEALYIAYHLKDTLEKTGNWGAVRVIPEASATVDITVEGRLIQSDGELVESSLKAYDSTGTTWVSKTYSDHASKFSYRLPQEDPFQDLYNEFANDLLAFRQKLGKDRIEQIKQVSTIVYARDLSPYAFSDYVEESSGRLKIKQLPAENDPMVARIERIKERDYLFIDTLDEFYGKFYREMHAPYHDWREYTYDEAINLRRIQAQAGKRFLTGAALIAGGLYAGSKSKTWAEAAASAGAVTGGIGSIVSGMNRKKEAEIHAESLKEISASLASEISPAVFEVEGHTIELKGTADGQYQKWRKILKEIYAEETGLPVD